MAFGIASVLWLKFIFNDTVIEITLTIAVSYFAYYTVCLSLDFEILCRDLIFIVQMRFNYCVTGSRVGWGFWCFDGDDFGHVNFSDLIFSFFCFHVRSHFLYNNCNRFFAAFARTAFKGDSQKSLHHFWYFSNLWNWNCFV